MAGARVLMARNGPPVERPGFGSNVSMWLGPPLSHKRMHALALGEGPGAASAGRDAKARATSAPKNALAPERRSARRSKAFFSVGCVIGTLSVFNV